MDMPSVYAYLDYRAFLRDWFDARKRGDSIWSHAAFGAAAGCSKSTLANVLSGTRSPRPGTLDAFARGMELSAAERNYLGLLVELASAQDLTHRRRTMERILASERYRQVRRAEDQEHDDVARFLEHWYLPAIWELARLPGFQDDPAWIAQTLHPPIREGEARQAVETLLDLGFLRRTESGVVREVVRFTTNPSASHPAVGRFHQLLLPDLLRAIDMSQHEEQHLVTATLALAKAALPEHKADLSAAIERLSNASDDPNALDGPARVYQVSVQLIPVTGTVG